MKMFAGLISRWMIPLRVGGIQSIGDLDAKIQQFVRGDGPSADSLLQGLAFQQLHDDERLAVLFLDFINRADVRMVQAEAARASRWKRLSARGSRANSSDRNLRATKRCRRMSSAL